MSLPDSPGAAGDPPAPEDSEDSAVASATDPRTNPIVPAPKRRKMLIAVGAILIVVLLAVIALWAGEIGPFSHSSSSSGVAGVPFSTAEVAANQSTNGLGQGPWKILLATGADPQSATAQSTVLPSTLFSSQGHPNCDGGPVGGAPSVVDFPSFSGNFSTGDAPVWLFALMNGSGALVFTIVINGRASAIDSYNGTGCRSLASVGKLPDHIADSSSAVTAALLGGGYGVVLAHPGGNMVFAAEDISGSGEWAVTYTTCPTEGPGTTGTTYFGFNATVDLLGGTLTGTVATGPQSCSGLNLAGGLQGI
jgi:hypothetical protein